MTSPRSKVERLARALRRLALLLLLAWFVAAAAAIAWVQDEFAGNAGTYRYITAVADMGTFLIAAVLAYVGSTIVESVGRVRSSIISAIFEQAHQRDLDRASEDDLFDARDQRVR